MGATSSQFLSSETAEEKLLRKMRKACREAAKFKIAYYTKVRDGYDALGDLLDIKELHYLFRIFYVHPSDEAVEAFEWDFFDPYRDVRMRMHSHDMSDGYRCASMMDVVRWYQKTEGERKALRRIGSVPKFVYCIGCLPDSAELLRKLLREERQKMKEQKAPSVQPVSSKAAKRLGMSPLDTADLAVTSNQSQSQNLLSVDTIGFPLRRSASVLLFPITECLERQYMKNLEVCKVEVGDGKIKRALSNIELLSPEEDDSDEKRQILVVGEDGIPFLKDASDGEDEEGEMDPEAARVLVRHMQFDYLCMSTEWIRVTDCTKRAGVKVKIRRRTMILNACIAGWEAIDKHCECPTFTKWLYANLKSPLHLNKLTSFEIFHFVPAFQLDAFPELDHKSLIECSQKQGELEKMLEFCDSLSSICNQGHMERRHWVVNEEENGEVFL